MGASLRTIVRPLLLVSGLGACTIARPFTAPEGAQPLPGDATVIVVITHAVLGDQSRDAFFDYTRGLVESLDRGDHPGLVGFSVRRQLLGDEVWTLTAWSSEAALDGFVESPSHRAAMAEAADAIEDMNVRRLELRARELPVTWDRALEALARRE